MHIIVCEASDEMDVQVALEMKVSANRKERDVMSCHIQQVGILFSNLQNMGALASLSLRPLSRMAL